MDSIGLRFYMSEAPWKAIVLGCMVAGMLAASPVGAEENSTKPMCVPSQTGLAGIKKIAEIANNTQFPRRDQRAQDWMKKQLANHLVEAIADGTDREQLADTQFGKKEDLDFILKTYDELKQAAAILKKGDIQALDKIKGLRVYEWVKLYGFHESEAFLG